MKNNKKNNNNSTQTSGNVINITNQASFRLIESFKALRTNIMFSLPKREGVKCRKILFTSSNPGEGKTTTTVNLAATIAQTEAKVLLIDADMRAPTVHKYFGIESRCGLSNFLSCMNTLEECIQTVKNIPNLSVIPSGLQPPNPSELLAGNTMDKLLEQAETEFDYIIVDTPPINVVTDALPLVNRVDGVAFVVAQGKSTYPAVTKAIKSLKFANANIMGVVMNRVESARTLYGKYGANHYKYKYKYKSNAADEAPYGTIEDN